MCTRSWHLPPVRPYELTILDAALDGSIVVCLPRHSMHVTFAMLLVKSVCSATEGIGTQCVIVVQSDEEVERYMEALSLVTECTHHHVAGVPSTKSAFPQDKVLVMTVLTLRLCLDNQNLSLATLLHLILPQCEHLTANSDWSHVSLLLKRTPHATTKVFCTTNMLTAWPAVQPSEEIQDIATELETTFHASLYFWQEHNEVDILASETVVPYSDSSDCNDLAPDLDSEYAGSEESVRRRNPETGYSGQPAAKLILTELISFLSRAVESSHLVAMARDGAAACLQAWSTYGAVACESLTGHVVTSLREYMEVNYSTVDTDATVPSSQDLCLAELAQSRLRAVAELCARQPVLQDAAACTSGKLQTVLELLRNHGYEQASIDVHSIYREPTADRFVEFVEHGGKRRCVVVLPACARWEAIALSAALNSALLSGDSQRAVDSTAAAFSIQLEARASCYLSYASPVVRSTGACHSQPLKTDTTLHADPSMTGVQTPTGGLLASSTTSSNAAVGAAEVICNDRDAIAAPMREPLPFRETDASPHCAWINCFVSHEAIEMFAAQRRHLDVLVTTQDSVGFYLPACSLAIMLDHHRMLAGCSSHANASDHMPSQSPLVRTRDAYTLQQDLCVRSMASTAAALCVSLVPRQNVPAMEAYMLQRKDAIRMLRRRSARHSVLADQDLDNPAGFTNMVLTSARESAASVANGMSASGIGSASPNSHISDVHVDRPEQDGYLSSSQHLYNGCYQLSEFQNMVDHLTENGIYIPHKRGDCDGVDGGLKHLTACSAVAVLNNYAKRIGSSDFLLKFSFVPRKPQESHLVGALDNEELDNEEQFVIASIQVPRIVHSLEARMPIMGKKCKTRYEAFQSAALRTCAMLHLVGELCDDFRTREALTMLDGSPSVLPGYGKWKNAGQCLSQVETYDITNAAILSKCLPQAHAPLHFYLVDYRINVAAVSRLCACFTDPFWDKSDVFFAIVSREQLIEISNIEVYPRIGPSLADIVYCKSLQLLLPSQLELLKRFHTCLFTDLISLDLDQCMADFDMADRNYLIAPVRVTQTSGDDGVMPRKTVALDYQLINDVLLYATCIHTNTTSSSNAASEAANPTSSSNAASEAANPTSSSNAASEAARDAAIPEVPVAAEISTAGHPIFRSGPEGSPCKLKIARLPELPVDNPVLSASGEDMLLTTAISTGGSDYVSSASGEDMSPTTAISSGGSDNAGQGVPLQLPKHDIRSWNYAKLKGMHVRSKHGGRELYLVTDVMHDESPLNEFQIDDGLRRTFVEYYSSRYGVEISDLSQPLLQAVRTTGKPDSKCPKENYYFHAESCARSYARSQDSFKKLVPELCDVVPLGMVPYRALACLPTVLEKLDHVMQIRQLRSQISTEAGFCQHDVYDSVDMSSFYDGGERRECAVGNERRTFCHRQAMAGGCKLHVKSCAAHTHGNYPAKHSMDDVSQCCSRPRCPPLGALMIVLTVSPENSITSMKRFELLGDVYIKQKCSQLLAVIVGPAREVFLTNLRSQLVCNHFLYQCGRDRNLPGYMRCSSTRPAAFVPPCFVRKRRENPGSSRLQFRIGAIANVAESLVGIFCHYTADGAAALCTWLGMFDTLPPLSDVDLYQRHVMSSPSTVYNALCLEVSGRSSGELAAASGAGHGDVAMQFGSNTTDALLHPPCPPSPRVHSATFFPVIGTCEVSPSGHTDHLTAVQMQLGYVFNDISWLTEALSHQSSRTQTSTGSYQFLEWLGDSFLDLLVVSQMYSDDRLSGWREGSLATFRSKLVRNTTLAKLSLRCHLQKYLQIGSAETLACILDYSRWWQSMDYQSQCNNLHQEVPTVDEGDQTLSSGFPKELADICEAVLAAVYMDSGMDLRAVWRVLEPLIMPLYETYVERKPSTELDRMYEAMGGQANGECSISNILPDGTFLCTVTRFGVGRFVGAGASPMQAQRRAVRLATASINE